MTGAMHCLGGLFSPPAFLIVLSQLILTCASIFHEDYEAQRWHVFLVYQFWNFTALAVLLYGSRILPLLSSIAGKKLFSSPKRAELLIERIVVFLTTGLFLTVGLLVGFASEKAEAQ